MGCNKSFYKYYQNRENKNKTESFIIFKEIADIFNKIKEKKKKKELIQIKKQIIFESKISDIFLLS